jgi:hypothetical protein
MVSRNNPQLLQSSSASGAHESDEFDIPVQLSNDLQKTDISSSFLNQCVQARYTFDSRVTLPTSIPRVVFQFRESSNVINFDFVRATAAFSRVGRGRESEDHVGRQGLSCRPPSLGCIWKRVTGEMGESLQ